MNVRRRLARPTAIFAALLVLLGTWVVAMPLFTSPDEAAHLFRAYAVAHGELLGDTLPGQSPNIRHLDVPEWMAPPADLGCYFGQPQVPASCAVGPHGTTDSSAGTYPPFWYAVVGGVARVTGQSTHQRAYRFIAAIGCAALMAAAFSVVAVSRARRYATLLLLGLTPMTMFLSGGVNPNAFEIAGFLLLWSLLLLVDHPRAPTAVGGVVLGCLAGAMLLARFASAMWLVPAVVVGAVMLGRQGLRRFVNRGFLLAALGTSGPAAVAVVAWSRWAGTTSDNPAVAVDWTTGKVVRHTIGLLPDLTKEMIGVLGWLDTELPGVVYVLVLALTLVALAGVVLSRDVRLMVAAGVVVAGLTAAPVVVNAASARSAGLIWQGRYSLPLFVALGVLGAIGWARADDRSVPTGLARAARWGAGGVFVLVQTVAFWAAVRRFTVGTDGRIWLASPLPWAPGIAPMVLVAVQLLAGSALVFLLLREDGPIGSSVDASIPQPEEHG